MSENNMGNESGRELKYATAWSEEVKKEYDVGKLHECGLNIYRIICRREVKDTPSFFYLNTV